LTGISVVPHFVLDSTALFASPSGTQAIATAPELSTWALALVGFGTLGLAAARKVAKGRDALANA
jgi:hypothetical protein